MDAKIIRYVAVFFDVIFVTIGAINIIELMDIVVYKEFYPFGSEFFAPYSIYQSKQIFVAFKICFTAIIIAMVMLSFWRITILFWLLVLLNTILLLYTFFSA
jgi:hypothetical protein